MKRATMLLLVLAGCATSIDDEPTGESQSHLTCDPFCDPQDHGYEPELQGAFNHGFALFADAVSTDVSCADVGTGVRTWDCVVTFTSSILCGSYVVECLDQGENRTPSCNWKVTSACP